MFGMSKGQKTEFAGPIHTHTIESSHSGDIHVRRYRKGKCKTITTIVWDSMTRKMTSYKTVNGVTKETFNVT